MFSCLVAVGLGLGFGGLFGGFGVWVSGCHILYQSYDVDLRSR